jgi:hypothetical protein
MLVTMLGRDNRHKRLTPANDTTPPTTKDSLISSPAAALSQASVAERPVVLPPVRREPFLMPLPFQQPPPPPCVKCGSTTVLDPVFEGGQRVFAVRCPACGRAGIYSLDHDTLRAW